MDEFKEELRAWKEENPRLWEGFKELGDNPLRDRVLLSIIKKNPDDPAIDELLRYTDALEHYQYLKDEGRFVSPPEKGLRRSFEVRILRLTKLDWNTPQRRFQFDFQTTQGWSGFFDTRNPLVVEKLTKHNDKPQLLVGEVEEIVFEFLVKLTNQTRVV
jgi:hypothetical protein